MVKENKPGLKKKRNVLESGCNESEVDKVEGESICPKKWRGLTSLEEQYAGHSFRHLFMLSTYFPRRSVTSMMREALSPASSRPLMVRDEDTAMEGQKEIGPKSGSGFSFEVVASGPNDVSPWPRGWVR